jgi:hypothetical protein
MGLVLGDSLQHGSPLQLWPPRKVSTKLDLHEAKSALRSILAYNFQRYPMSDGDQNFVVRLSGDTMLGPI